MSKIKQPNSRHCFVCGVENPIGLRLSFYEVDDGVVETEFIAGEQFQGYPGVLHGGITASVLDEVTSRAYIGADAHHPRFVFTGKLEVKYRKNVPIGKLLKFVGKVTKNKSRVIEAWGGVYDGETNELLAEGTGLHIEIPKGTFDTSVEGLEEIGWKVYAD
jgi:acyl-coenzyme A thioesterase PaaI-like protein